MELRDIQSFIEVANHQSFTKAAEHSYLSQPSLSKAVKKLEEEFHMELLERSTRHIQLTDAGKVVYEQGKKLMSILEETKMLLDELANVAIGEIKIGIPPLIGTGFFPSIAGNFHQQYPNVKLELVEVGARVVEQLVEEGEIDVGIVVLPVDESIFHISSFFTDEFVLFIHKDHSLACKQRVSVKELEKESFILFAKNFTLHEFIINTCKNSGFTPNIAYESSQWDLILELVSSKMGITLLPKVIGGKQNNPDIVIIPLKEKVLWHLGIITKKGRYRSFALKKLLEMLTEQEK
ncbi:LysR family transcriptional regulator [Bacillaceae bacterium ZC4]|uniref:LysR family transcriptional regulator n=1 Tax=Aeribacillus sp. FSL K6-2848 TaxID=2954612 RepID=UPI00118C9F14|nr:LysR family transcriptional regulator [Bacillaceae bacterium ZC4]